MTAKIIINKEADISPLVYRTGYYGEAVFHVNYDILTSMRSGEWLTIRT